MPFNTKHSLPEARLPSNPQIGSALTVLQPPVAPVIGFEFFVTIP
jgi:hypothetical protein